MSGANDAPRDPERRKDETMLTSLLLWTLTAVVAFASIGGGYLILEMVVDAIRG